MNCTLRLTNKHQHMKLKFVIFWSIATLLSTRGITNSSARYNTLLLYRCCRCVSLFLHYVRHLRALQMSWTLPISPSIYYWNRKVYFNFLIFVSPLQNTCSSVRYRPQNALSPRFPPIDLCCQYASVWRIVQLECILSVPPGLNFLWIITIWAIRHHSQPVRLFVLNNSLPHWLGTMLSYITSARYA